MPNWFVYWIDWCVGYSYKRLKRTSIVNAFKRIISEKNEAESKGWRKPNKIWVDQGGEF